METIKLNLLNSNVKFTSDAIKLAKDCCEKLHKGYGLGNDFLGWLNLPSQTTTAMLDDINRTAQFLQSECQIVVVVGIGGSYLGAKAIVEALSNSFNTLIERKYPLILYAGHNIDEEYMFELQELLKKYRFGIICISKSGTTTEPAIAFRLLRRQLEAQQGKEAAKKLIVAITDKERGALKTMADKNGYKQFVIEDNIGGRFSVLTAVGLLPIAVAGFNINALVEGAKTMEEATGVDVPFKENIAMQYAAVRNILYGNNRGIEILANFNHKLHYISEWWKQLFGESEGKENLGIFPASVSFTTDLHSMGQYIQSGQRILFETVLSVENQHNEVIIPYEEEDIDGLNYISNRRIDIVNKIAETGTVLAHVDGDVPNIQILLPSINEHSLGQLIYFFEKSCGISGYMQEINPFNQPGVEEYKKNMFALLNKPGYEGLRDKIMKKLNY